MIDCIIRKEADPVATAIARVLCGEAHDDGVTAATLKRAMEMGMLPKSALRDGAFYEGHNDEASCARWSERHQRFFLYNHRGLSSVWYPFVTQHACYEIFVPTGEANWYDVVCTFAPVSEHQAFGLSQNHLQDLFSSVC